MLAWLPIIGPIIEGITSAYNKSKDTQVALYTQDTLRKGKETDADVAVINARAQVSIAQDSIGNRLMRDVAMFPIVSWVFLKFWELIFSNVEPTLVIHVLDVPDNIKYIPYAVVGYLFVTAYRGR